MYIRIIFIDTNFSVVCVWTVCFSDHSFSLLLAANMERSNLYLKLFKLVFGSVSLFASENEQMLKVGNKFFFFWV